MGPTGQEYIYINLLIPYSHIALMQITGVKITTQKKGKEIVVPLSQKEMKKRAGTRAPLGFRGVGGRWDEVGTKSAKSLKTLKNRCFPLFFFLITSVQKSEIINIVTKDIESGCVQV